MQSIDRTEKEMENKIEFTDREKKIIQAWEILTDSVASIDYQQSRVDYGSKDRREKLHRHYIYNELQKKELLSMMKFDIAVILNGGR